jgi:hypothetical protein
VTKQKRWSHLSDLELKYGRDAIDKYEIIIKRRGDAKNIAENYGLIIEDVKRAKNYAFASCAKYGFCPDVYMAEAWERLSLGQGNNIDKILLMHEILESDLVINKGMAQVPAHEVALLRYPWGERLMESREKERRLKLDE